MGGQIEFGRLGGLFAGNVRDHVLNQKPALLLHFDGADAATATSDSGGTNHTINFNGTAQLDTDQSKFFGSSLLLDGDSDYLDIDDHADWDIGTNFTIDLFFKLGEATWSGTNCIIQHYEDDTNYWILNATNPVQGSGARFSFKIKSGDFIVDCDCTSPYWQIDITKFHHLAMCKVGNEYGIYVDGIQRGHTSDADIDTFAGSLYIGADGNDTQHYLGWLGEIRIIKFNVFGAAPNSGKTDTIAVPSIPYISWR